MNRTPVLNASLSNGVLLSNNALGSSVWLMSYNAEEILACLSECSPRPRFFKRFGFAPCLVAFTVAIVVIAFVGESFLLLWFANGTHGVMQANVTSENVN